MGGKGWYLHNKCRVFKWRFYILLPLGQDVGDSVLLLQVLVHVPTVLEEAEAIAALHQPQLFLDVPECHKPLASVRYRQGRAFAR